jgi:hypothetical protein
MYFEVSRLLFICELKRQADEITSGHHGLRPHNIEFSCPAASAERRQSGFRQVPRFPNVVIGDNCNDLLARPSYPDTIRAVAVTLPSVLGVPLCP